MIRFLYALFFLLFTTISIANENTWLDQKPSYTCEVLQNDLFHMQTKNPGQEWQSNIIRLYKGDIIPKFKHRNTPNDYWYINQEGAFFKLTNFDNMDRVVWKDPSHKKREKDIMDCIPYYSKSIKIEFETYNVFTQNDLYDGFADNESQTAFGILEYPNAKRCKDKKFPLMFLVHHSGGDIVQTYKYYLHNQCVATFEPKIFQSRGHKENYYDTDRDIVWITETQGAVDVLKAIDVVSAMPEIQPDKIGIMGWSYGAIVALESQNMFNVSRINPKNKFSLHLSYYPYCYHYDDNTTTDSTMVMFLGEKDYLPYTICKEYFENLASKENKFMYVYEKALHYFDGSAEVLTGATLVSPECRIHTDLVGRESVRPNKQDQWFDLTANGGWFGNLGEKALHELAMELCWKYDRAFQGRNQVAFEDSFDKFEYYIKMLKHDR